MVPLVPLACLVPLAIELLFYCMLGHSTLLRAATLMYDVLVWWLGSRESARHSQSCAEVTTTHDQSDLDPWAQVPPAP